MRIILLLGSSSSGKSTLCNGVMAMARPEWKIRDSDTFGRYCVGLAVETFSKMHDIQGLLSDLAMSPDQIVNFAMTGKLQTSLSIPHQFQNHELTDVEQVLKKLKISDDRIQTISNQLRNLVKNHTELEVLFPKPNEEFLNRFFEKIFSETFVSNDTLIIDVNPHPEVGPAIITKIMDQHIERYSEEHNLLIESFKVLVYCPLEILSDRVLKRLENKKDDDYMGIGIFPFEQVAMLVNSQRTEEKSEYTLKTKDSIGQLSRNIVYDIANKHIKSNKDEPLVIVDTEDLHALDSYVSGIPLVAPKPVVEAYHFLADKFGFRANETRIELSISSDFQCDVIIDTNKQNAKDLVDEIDRITQNREANEPASTRRTPHL